MRQQENGETDGSDPSTRVPDHNSRYNDYYYEADGPAFKLPQKPTLPSNF